MSHGGALLCIFLVLLPLALSYPWNDDDRFNDFDDEKAVNVFTKLQRRGWCSRWGDYCVPDAKVKYAECCEGLRCVCGKFWTQKKCQCKTQSAFGR